MAHESFEDDATAAQLNADFVCVKVDREERPDVDAVYMEATVSMTGQGGWPMTVVLDHDGSPFFAGTYFPDRPRMGQPSLRQVLTALTEAWRDRPDDVRRAAASVREHLARQTEPRRRRPDRRRPDRRGRPRCARTSTRRTAASAARRSSRPRWCSSSSDAVPGHDERAMLDATLEAMARGGIHDQLGGGFARYSVDDAWVVPHFEKMLYDNAQLVGLYARWGTPLGDRVARLAADFLLRELRTTEGGLASALDADSEGEEGRFYVWTPDGLIDVLGADDGRWATELFAVTGTFEHGTSTLQLPRDPDDWERFDDVRERLLAARETRVRPARDDKVVAAWNGLAVAGSATPVGCSVARSTSTRRLAAGRLLADLHLVDGRLRRVSRDGRVGAPAGVLEDYGAVAGGFLALCGVTADEQWLERADRAARRGAAALPGRRRRLPRHAGGRRAARRAATRPERQRQPVRDVGHGARPAGSACPHRRGALARRRRGGADDGGDAGPPRAAVRRVVAGRRAGAGRRCARDRGGRAGGPGPRRARAAGALLAGGGGGRRRR